MKSKKQSKNSSQVAVQQQEEMKNCCALCETRAVNTRQKTGAHASLRCTSEKDPLLKMSEHRERSRPTAKTMYLSATPHSGHCRCWGCRPRRRHLSPLLSDPRRCSLRPTRPPRCTHHRAAPWAAAPLRPEALVNLCQFLQTHWSVKD